MFARLQILFSLFCQKKKSSFWATLYLFQVKPNSNPCLWSKTNTDTNLGKKILTTFLKLYVMRKMLMTNLFIKFLSIKRNMYIQMYIFSFIKIVGDPLFLIKPLAFFKTWASIFEHFTNSCNCRVFVNQLRLLQQSRV